RASALLGDPRRALWCFDHARFEVGGSHDLQHLEILRTGDLTMLDAGGLQDRIALADRALALSLVFEGCPAVQDEDELEGAIVDVPFLHLVLRLASVVADQVGHIIALRPLLDAEVTVLEDLTQAGGPRRLARLVVHEPPISLAHRNPPCVHPPTIAPTRCTPY